MFTFITVQRDMQEQSSNGFTATISTYKKLNIYRSALFRAVSWCEKALLQCLGSKSSKKEIKADKTRKSGDRVMYGRSLLVLLRTGNSDVMEGGEQAIRAAQKEWVLNTTDTSFLSTWHGAVKQRMLQTSKNRASYGRASPDLP